VISTHFYVLLYVFLAPSIRISLSAELPLQRCIIIAGIAQPKIPPHPRQSRPIFPAAEKRGHEEPVWLSAPGDSSEDVVSLALVFHPAVAVVSPYVAAPACCAMALPQEHGLAWKQSSGSTVTCGQMIAFLHGLGNSVASVACAAECKTYMGFLALSFAVLQLNGSNGSM
jgi:hypothetical protein